jgi:hypothetical protein
LDEIGLVLYEGIPFKVKVYGRTDGEKHHKSSPCHFVTGELKINDPWCQANFDPSAFIFLIDIHWKMCLAKYLIYSGFGF